MPNSIAVRPVKVARVHLKEWQPHPVSTWFDPRSHKVDIDKHIKFYAISLPGSIILPPSADLRWRQRGLKQSYDKPHHTRLQISAHYSAQTQKSMYKCFAYRQFWIKSMHAHKQAMTLKGDEGQTGLIVSSRAYWFFPHSYFYTPPSHSFASAVSSYFSFPPFLPALLLFSNKVSSCKSLCHTSPKLPLFLWSVLRRWRTQPQSNLRSWLESFQNNSGTRPQKALRGSIQTRAIDGFPKVLSQVPILLHLTSLRWSWSSNYINKSLNIKTY